MSAIFGAFSPRAPLDTELGPRMNEALAARPADAVHHALRGPCLLGARSLWVTPEAEHKPPVFVDEVRDLHIVADVRLDYREALLEKLADGGAGLSNLADEALIARAYLRWGEDCPRELEGDFAFALWDGARQKLLLARDVYGVRALYYAEQRGGLLFASQARALFADSTLVRRADAVRVAEYVARVFVDHERTFFEGVKRLPPAHLLVADATGVRLRRYFQFDATRKLELPNTAAYTEAFRTTFDAAVDARARSNSQVTCMLSGGLDSSGVLASLKRGNEGRAVPCFSATFPDFPQIDESSWLKLHEAAGGLTLHTTRADRIGPLDEADELHEMLDEPFHAPNLFIYAALAKLAKAYGGRIILDGLDGDTVVEHGWLFLNELLMTVRLRRLVREMRALHRRAGFPYAYLLGSWALGPTLQKASSARRVLRPESVSLGYLDRDFARQTGFFARCRAQAQAELRAPLRFRAQHAHALAAPLMPFYLEVHDKLAAALGVDHRHPFFDRRVIELCLAMPAEQRLFDGWDRAVERRAFDGRIPDAIVGRISKSVWSENFRRQLFERNGGRIDSIVNNRTSRLSGIIDLERLRRDLPSVRERGSDEPMLDLWTAVTLGAWLERNAVTL